MTRRTGPTQTHLRVNRHLAPVLTAVMMRDISEAKKIREMMIQTEKMISVGGIAAGIAHEINNPLGIVLQAAQNMTILLDSDGHVVRIVKVVRM